VILSYYAHARTHCGGPSNNISNDMRLVATFACFAGLCHVGAGGQSNASDRPVMLTLEGDVEGVHDPVIIREKKTYYVFSTNGPPGRLIPIRCSPDLTHWKLCGHVFDKLPEWAVKEVPGARAPWAPDIAFFNGQFHLYYSISTFGSMESAIGLATNETLDSTSPKYKWTDHGMVVRSHKQDDWNAIDPNLVLDGKRAWLIWGSFWSGIKMKQIDVKTGKVSADSAQLYSVAARPRTPEIRGAIEAPFVVKRGKYWYLFVSFDACCRGAKSTYNIVVGRSDSMTGKFVDRQGTPMLEGGGTPVLKASESSKWRGPGHNAILHDKGTDYLVFHAYNGATGKSSLQIATIVWRDGWPEAAELP
jgi:arabinan endo-1,5-alpha-L-arabinosidase